VPFNQDIQSNIFDISLKQKIFNTAMPRQAGMIVKKSSPQDTTTRTVLGP
jgi:hypothetical protein